MAISINRTPLIASTLGNTLEWYDFFIYGILAPILSQVFFPATNQTVALLATFGAFAAGFLVRPIGGFFFGQIGDRIGRRTALLWSIGLMMIPTVLFGLLPSYQKIGIWAPVLVVTTRVMQGLAVGGEFTGSMCYLAETAPANRRGFCASFAFAGVLLGILLGTILVKILTASISTIAMEQWGWRVPFLLTSILGITVLIIRKYLPETPAYLYLKKHEETSDCPLRDCIKEDLLGAMQIFLIAIFNSIGFYLIIVYTPTYFNQIHNFSMNETATMSIVLTVTTLIFIPIMGELSDRFGRRPLMMGSTIGFIILAYPINLLLIKLHSLTAIILVQMGIAIFIAAYIGPMIALLTELLPTRVRYTGLSVAYNLCLAIFGGTATIVATYFIKEMHIIAAPGLMLIIAGIISLVTLYFVPERSRLPLE